MSNLRQLEPPILICKSIRLDLAERSLQLVTTESALGLVSSGRIDISDNASSAPSIIHFLFLKLLVFLDLDQFLLLSYSLRLVWDRACSKRSSCHTTIYLPFYFT